MKARRFAWRGEVVASGLWLVRDARARALRAWQPGVAVTQVDVGLVLRWPEPRPIRVDSALGHPLVDVDGRLCTAPLNPDQLGPIGTLHRVQAEQVQELAGSPVDPADWLELDMPVLSARSLGVEPRPVPVTPGVAADGRAALGQPPASPDVDALLKALAQGRPAPADPPAWAQALGGALAGLRSLFDSDQPASPSGEPGWLDQLDSWLAQQLVESGLGSLVGKAHAEHLRDLMEMLDGDDVDAALRNAIPLGGEGGLDQALAGLRRATPRGDLRVTAGRTSSSIALGGELMERLREQYRTMHRRLLAAGELDKAAFVLAELLNQPLEAVALLEEHERWAAAAELAQVRKLDPALVVRLWFVAGEIDRAVQEARRRGGLDGAVTRLEARDKDQARQLRIVWAASLAADGSYAAAATQGRKAGLQNTRALADWSDKAIEAGGVGGANELVARLAHAPQDWRPRYQQAAPWLDGTRPAHELGHALVVDLPKNGEPLARSVLRRVLLDQATDGQRNARLLHKLRQTVSGGLSVDRATDAPVTALGLDERLDPLRIAIGPDPGAGVAHAARWLPSNRWLVARGEAGIELLDAHRRLLRRWERPAHDLAVHAEGTHAIAMAHRGSLKHLTRIDLTNGSAETWCDARIDAFARTFSGSWVVRAGADLLAIDPAHASFRGTWRLDFPEPPEWLHIDAVGIHFVSDAQQWHIGLPSLALQSRTPTNAGLVGPDGSHILAAQGNRLVGAVPDGAAWRFFDSNTGQGRALSAPPIRVAFAGKLLAAVTTAGVDVTRVGDWKGGLHLDMPDARGLDLDPDTLVAWDDHGRLIAIDVPFGRVRSEIRL